MATAKHSSSRLSDKEIYSSPGNPRFDAGTYIGIIKDNKDPAHSGRLWIWIQELGGSPTDRSNWYLVQYASPFFGITSQGDTASPDNDWTKTSHSYGFWAVPPDLDNKVLVTFVMGDPTRGYWFACISAKNNRYMTPGISVSNKIDKTHLSSDLSAALTGGEYPVADYNEYDLGIYSKINKVDDIKKPIHESQVRILLEQGLQDDAVRGQTTSSAERESPSFVIGISSPGRDSGNTSSLTKNKSPKYRLGGHQFVLDDGDVSGDNNLIRLRSSGGHQVLLDDSENIVYIANANGTSWLEFTSDGHIHMYAESDFSIRSQTNVNIHADQDINIHAGNDMNVFAVNNITTQAKNIYTTGTVDVNTTGGKVEVVSHSTLQTSSKTDTSIESMGNFIVSSANNSSILAGTNLLFSSGASSSIGAGSGVVLASPIISLGGATINLNGQINMNTGGSPPAGTAPSAPQPASAPLLTPSKFIDVVKTGLKWSQTGSINSIAVVVPTHEPWIIHGSSSAQTLAKDNISPSAAQSDAQDPLMSAVGPKSAIGAGVKNPISAAALSVQPPTSLSGGIGKMSANNVNALKAQIGGAAQYASVATNSAGKVTGIGKYALNAKALSAQGFVASATSSLADPASWTGKNGVTSGSALLNSPTLQENIMDNNLDSLHSDLINSGTISPSTSAGVISGVLNVANSIGTANTATWIKTGADASGLAKTAFNQGRYASNISSGPVTSPNLDVNGISSVTRGIVSSI